MISGKTTLIAHIGYPTESFKAPLIYNPWFDAKGIDAVVVPMGCRREDYPAFLKALFRLTNIRGALVTMPHKVTTVALADEATTTVKIAGSANALLKRPDGTLLADMFDGTGFTRGLARKGMRLAGARCLVVGAGGVGSAIAASLAAEGVAAITLHDTHAASAEALADAARAALSEARGRGARQRSCRLRPRRQRDAARNEGRRSAAVRPGATARRTTFVGEVVMKKEITPLLRGGAETGLPLRRRHRHAVRDDSRLPRVLRLRHRDARRTARGGEGRVLSGRVPHDAKETVVTDRYALFGNPAKHSKSPLIHAAYARETGQDLTYEIIEAPLDGFAAAVAAFRASGGRGGNVTMPFKLEAFALATDRSERARRAGAVNTLKFEGDRIRAENFDGVGLVNDIERNLGRSLAGKRVLLLGAGGAVRGALLPFLEQKPALLVVANRTVAKAKSTRHRVRGTRRARDRRLRRHRRPRVRHRRQRDVREHARRAAAGHARSVRAGVPRLRPRVRQGAHPVPAPRARRGRRQAGRRRRHAGRAGGRRRSCGGAASGRRREP